MKQLLVPTDFSTCANNAVDFAVQSAKLFPAQVTLLHAFDIQGSTYTDYLGVNKEYNQSILEEIQQKLTDLRNSIEETEGVIVDTVIYNGTVKAAVVQAAADLHVDLIIMGTLGAGALKEKIWGSKTAALIGVSKVPVLVIPFFYVWKKPEKLLLATSHFEQSAALLDVVFELADLYMTQIQVAVFTDEDDDEVFTMLEHGRRNVQYEVSLKKKYKKQVIVAKHLYGKKFEETLQEYIKNNDIDLLIMITYRRSFWEQLFHPSKTKRMSYLSMIPMLAMPADKE